MQNFASRWSKQHNFRSSDRRTQLLIACKCMLCYSIMIFFFLKLHFLIFILKVSRRVLISGGSGTRKSSMDWTIARFRVSKHEFRIGQIIRTRPNLVPSIHFHGLISGRWPKIWFLSYSIWWHFVIVLRCFKTRQMFLSTQWTSGRTYDRGIEILSFLPSAATNK